MYIMIADDIRKMLARSKIIYIENPKTVKIAKESLLILFLFNSSMNPTVGRQIEMTITMNIAHLHTKHFFLRFFVDSHRSVDFPDVNMHRRSYAVSKYLKEKNHSEPRKHVISRDQNIAAASRFYLLLKTGKS